MLYAAMILGDGQGSSIVTEDVRCDGSEDDVCFTFAKLVHSRNNDDDDGQQFAEGEENLNPCCPCHTHTVQVHNRSYMNREESV